ncbi:MAG: Fe-Mn family superoxide dismutase [Nibricoccus sp.]
MNYPGINDGSGLTRRDALKTLGATAALLGLGLFQPTRATAESSTAGKALVLPKLPYAYDALEPHFDARTMELHHTKHHQAYINNANKVLEKYADRLAGEPNEILTKLDALPEPDRTALRNNLGGHVNHAFFWKVIGPNAGGAPQGELAQAITKTFVDYDKFKAQFSDAAMKRFGSGWAWLVISQGQLAIKSTANQDSPWIDGDIPVVGLDVWEHAYYLKYQNRRADYIAAFWNVVNWTQAEAHFGLARSRSGQA